jgi:hypothetical protein
VIGACIYAAYGLLGPADEQASEMQIVVDEARVNGFIAAWQGRMNRPPTQQELDGMVNQYIREDILYREAVAMGLGKDDPITRRRLAQKLEFLTKDIARLKEPAGGELEAWFEANKDDYREPKLITFSHAFIDPDKRGEATLDDAEQILIELRKRGEPAAEDLELGDRFMLQSFYPQKSELEVRKQLGSGFSEVVMTLEPAQWHGPVLSGYGVHLVYVHSLQDSPEPVFAEVQEQVFESWQAEQQELFNQLYFDSLKSRYEIVIDLPPEGGTVRQAGSLEGSSDATPGNSAGSSAGDVTADPVSSAAPDTPAVEAQPAT